MPTPADTYRHPVSLTCRLYLKIMRLPRIYLDGEIGQSILKEYDNYGVKALGWGEGGFRHLVTLNKAVREPADMKGLKIRCMETETYLATYAALGVNAVPMAWSETITGLQQGTIDGL